MFIDCYSRFSLMLVINLDLYMLPLPNNSDTLVRKLLVTASSISREWFLPSEGRQHVDVQGNDLRLAPFGTGRWVCPGKAFGLSTVHPLVAKLVHHLTWLPSPKHQVDVTHILKLSWKMEMPITAIRLNRIPAPSTKQPTTSPFELFNLLSCAAGFSNSLIIAYMQGAVIVLVNQYNHLLAYKHNVVVTTNFLSVKNYNLEKHLILVLTYIGILKDIFLLFRL